MRFSAESGPGASGTERVVERWPLVLRPVDLAEDALLILLEGRVNQTRRTVTTRGVTTTSTVNRTHVEVCVVPGEMPHRTRGWPDGATTGIWLTLARGADSPDASTGTWEAAERRMRVRCPPGEDVSRRVRSRTDRWEVEPFNRPGGPLGYDEDVVVSIVCRGIGPPEVLTLEPTSISAFLDGRDRWLSRWE